jgi:DNA topoisomerase I
MTRLPRSHGDGSPPEHAVDPAESARAARLRYVIDAAPGIRRRRAGRTFHYLMPDGTPVRDAETLARIRSLAIPPAWREVWICPDPRGHLQATGYDSRGRKQYRYHDRWREVRDAVKYDRMIAFGEALPAIRRRVDRDLALTGFPREKVLAAVVRLLDTTLVRVGNEEYRRENRSFGLTTLQNRHAQVAGSRVTLRFRGKGGKWYDVQVVDRRLARVVKMIQEVPGQELFQYLDDHGERHTVESGDVNEYLREISGGDFTAKDFRTWGGSVQAHSLLCGCECLDSEQERRRIVAGAVEQVAEILGNTPTICRKSYVHPDVIEAYMQGALAAPRIPAPAARGSLAQEERAFLLFLRARQSASGRAFKAKGKAA